MRKLIVAIALALGLQGIANAGFAEGANAYNAHDYAQALKQVTPLAKAGSADAQYLLGLMYYMGQGVPQDFKQAFTWHHKAALQGKADAQYVVGAMYYKGTAVPQDQKLAVSWFRKAAEQNHAEAQKVLGQLYRYSVAGMPQDVVLAYLMSNLAAANGNAKAAEQRAAVARQMTQEQIDEAQALSRNWKPGTPLPTTSRTGEAAM